MQAAYSFADWDQPLEQLCCSAADCYTSATTQFEALYALLCCRLLQGPGEFRCKYRESDESSQRGVKAATADLTSPTVSPER
jgi:hypothetical protein